ncbi:MAG TPA: hypothetical protein PLA90_02855 [Candidatus Sumerlaeota bacterium]|nr:hypothetical protein [Candidatus Sumerlaeota bacterium]HPS00460.1 hypothetical protein [Candidatus Sumerlaeota bacterium]
MEINHDMIRTERCARAFGNIFWSCLFFFDFRIGFNGVQVDILPDFIGWILIAFILSDIRDLSPKVGNIRTLVLCLIFFSLFDLVEIKKTVQLAAAVTTYITLKLESPFQMMGSILSIFVVWEFFGLITGMADAVGDTLIRERSEFRRTLFLIFIVSLPVTFGIALLAPSFALLFLVVEISFALIVFCLLMGLLKGIENMCRGYWR